VRFVDSNVLLYSVSTVTEEVGKAEVARQLMASHDVGLSVQVLQEFYVQATRTTRPDRLAHDLATGLIGSWQRFPVQPLTVSVMTAALHTCERFTISYWDAAIIEAARELGCDVVLSEDLNDGQEFDGLGVINPFA
jgi:predicted nucleic acid-binding protein